jgi:hypothetical protein
MLEKDVLEALQSINASLLKLIDLQENLYKITKQVNLPGLPKTD